MAADQIAVTGAPCGDGGPAAAISCVSACDGCAVHSALSARCDTAALRELEGRAQALSRTVGELRDADVLIDHIYAPVAGTMGAVWLAALRRALLAPATVRASGACGTQWAAMVGVAVALWPQRAHR
jgi:hypothetical protein